MIRTGCTRQSLDNPRRRFGWHRYVMLATVLLDRWLNLSRSVYVVPHSSPTAVAPFVHQVHCSLTVLASFVFIVFTTYVWLAHPFTPDARIKVFFAQMVGLTNVTSAVSRPQLTHAITQLNVIEIYGGRLAATLSSSWSSIDDSESVHCIVCRGLTTCERLSRRRSYHRSQAPKAVIRESDLLRTSRASDLPRSMSLKASRHGRVPFRSKIMESGATVHVRTRMVARPGLARELPQRGPPLRYLRRKRSVC